MDLLPFLELRDTSVFILPSWSNETFIYSFLRKLDVSRDASSYIVVYGMPQAVTKAGIVSENINIDIMGRRILVEMMPG